ncbi:hypothetical protein CsSME_00014933 [Camellia sinensis var. sinensis]
MDSFIYSKEGVQSKTVWGASISLLNGNKLSGFLPSELGHLNNNSLSGHIPPQLSNLSNLLHMLLDNNNLTGHLPPEFSNIPELRILEEKCLASNPGIFNPFPQSAYLRS